MPVESVGALLLTAHMAVYLMIVIVAALLSTILTVAKRKYAQRKPKQEDPTAPLCPGCPYGYRRIKKSGTTYKPTCRKCKADKKNGRTRRRSSSASASEEDGVAESSQQQGTAACTSASTLRRSSGDIVSPRPNHAGRAPRGHTWSGSQYQPDDPNAPQNVARRTHARGGRGFSTLQAFASGSTCRRATRLFWGSWWTSQPTSPKRRCRKLTHRSVCSP